MGVYSISLIVLITLSFLLRKRNFKYRYIFIATTILILISYSLWKISIMPKIEFPIILNIILVTIDLFFILKTLVMLFVYVCENSDKYNIKIDTNTKYKPSVDIIIYIEYESIDLIRKVIIACKNLIYDNKKLNIYICNSKEDPDVKYLADIYGVTSFEFCKNNKAEILNEAISKTNGEIITILEANEIVKKEFLMKVIKYFYNKNVAYIQAMNMYMPNNAIRSILKKVNIVKNYNIEFKEAYTGMVHNTRNIVYRRKAIEKVGGFSKNFINTDIAMGLSMEMEGYKGICVFEPLVISIDVVKTKLYMKRIELWAAGVVQLMKNIKIYSNKKIYICKKLHYTYSLIQWFDVINKLIILIGFLLYIYMVPGNFKITLYEIVCNVIPMILLLIIYNKIFIPKRIRSMNNRYFNIITYPYICKGLIFSLFSNKYIYIKEEEYKVYLRDGKDTDVVIANPYLILLTITIASVLYSENPESIFGVILRHSSILLFALLYLINLNNHIKIINYVKKENKDEKIIIEEEVFAAFTCNNKTINSKVIGISDREISLKLDKCINVEKYASSKITIDGQVIYGGVIECYDNIVDIRFGNLSEEEYEVIITIYLNNLKISS